MSLIKKLAGETAIYGGSTILNRLLNFVIVTPYLTRVFDDERQGEYAIHGLMYGFSALLLVVLTYGMETAFFRFASREKREADAFSTASLSLLFTTIAAVLLLIYFAGPVAGLMTTPDDAPYVTLFAFIIGFDVLSAVPFAKLRLDNRPLRFALFKAINIVVNGVFLIFFLEGLPLLADKGAVWAGALYHPGGELTLVFVANLIASALTLLLFLPEFLRIRLAFDVALWRRMIVYALPLVIVGVAGMINQLADRFLLVYLLPGSPEEQLRQIGVYIGCTRIAVLMSLFTQAFRYASEPFFFRYAEQSDARLVYARVGQAFAVIGSLGFLGIMLYIDVWRYLIDPSYWKGLGVVPVLLLAYLCLGLYYNLSVWYKLTDRTGLGGYVSLAGVVITLAANYWLIPILGIMGAAWATFACFAFMLIASYWMGQYYYPVPYPVGRILAYIIGAVVVFLISDRIRSRLDDHFLTSLAVNTVLLLVYLSALFWLEKREIFALLRRFRR